MSYRFIRYKFYSETSDWVFKPETLQDVIDFNEKYTNLICDNGLRNIYRSLDETSNWVNCTGTKRYFFGAHPTTYYEQAFERMTYATRITTDSTVNDIANNIKESCTSMRIELFNGGQTICMPSNGLATITLSTDELNNIIDEVYMDDIIFPDICMPSIKDVNFIQWEGGKHWYAKIGREDIVVDGNQKWNSRREAEIAAYRYLKENRK